MSLTVSPELHDKARRGPVTDDEFIACIRESLPYAWDVITRRAEQIAPDRLDYAANEVPPPGEKERGQLLRLLASDAMRGAVQRHFGLRLAFQNCHKVALFRPDAETAYQDFITPRAQLLNQSPELVDC